jgi:hypothetical protein
MRDPMDEQKPETPQEKAAGEYNNLESLDAPERFAARLKGLGYYTTAQFLSVYQMGPTIQGLIDDCVEMTHEEVAKMVEQAKALCTPEFIAILEEPPIEYSTGAIMTEPCGYDVENGITVKD